MQKVTIDLTIKDGYNHIRNEIKAEKEIGIDYILYQFKESENQSTIYKLKDDSLEIINNKEKVNINLFLSKTTPSKVRISFEDRWNELEARLLKYEKNKVIEIEYILVDDPQNVHSIKFYEKR